MRIGLVTSWQERGAAYVSRQYRDVLKNNHEVFIYARGGEAYAIGDKNWDEPTVTWGKKIPLHMPLSIDLADFKKWLRKNRLETVFFNEQQWWDPVLLCVQLGIKTGAYVDYYTEETVPFFALYDFLICNTRRHQEVFAWHPQAAFTPWGTDLGIFKPLDSAPVAAGFVTFFHSAGVSPERKGTDLVIKAFARLHGPAKLIIHSQTDLIKNYPELAGMMDILIKEKRLIIEQKTVPAPGLYHLGDVYAYPSRLDGIGLTLAEALACGLPAITSDNPPMNEFVNESNGQLVKIDRWHDRPDGYYWPLCEPNLDSLKEKMEIYINNINSLSDYKKQARVYAAAHLDWRHNSRDLPRLFEEFKIIPAGEKMPAIENITAYEKKRSNWQTKLYRRQPWLFKPFAWLWPLIKNRYKQK